MSNDGNEPNEVEEYPVVTVKGKPPIEDVEQMVKDRPYVAQMVQLQILYDLASIMEDNLDELTQLRKDFQSTIPDGVVRPYKLSITQDVTDIRSKEGYNTMPWASFVLTNDGPDDIYVTVNENYIISPTKNVPILNGESLSIDMKARKIDRILIHCLEDLTSTIRIFGKS